MYNITNVVDVFFIIYNIHFPDSVKSPLFRLWKLIGNSNFQNNVWKYPRNLDIINLLVMHFPKLKPNTFEELL